MYSTVQHKFGARIMYVYTGEIFKRISLGLAFVDMYVLIHL